VSKEPEFDGLVDGQGEITLLASGCRNLEISVATIGQRRSPDQGFFDESSFRTRAFQDGMPGKFVMIEGRRQRLDAMVSVLAMLFLSWSRDREFCPDWRPA
jgi:hypothetical protein